MLYKVNDKKRYSILCLTLLAKGFLCTVGSTITVGQDVLQRVEGVPGLGRGYSTTTNTFLSSCLEVKESELEHSYNYECEFGCDFGIGQIICLYCKRKTDIAEFPLTFLFPSFLLFVLIVDNQNMRQSSPLYPHYE